MRSSKPQTRQYLFILGLVCLFLRTSLVCAEDVKATLTMPDLTPGQSSTFTLAPTSSGASGNCAGTATENWSGVLSLSASSCSGRYDGKGGTTTYGFRFDSFNVFRSLLSPTQFVVTNSNPYCPAAPVTYNFLLLRTRNYDDYVSPTDFTSNSAWVGGTITYDSTASPILNGTARFSLNSLTSVSTAFGSSGFKGESCGGQASGELRTSALAYSSSNRPLDTYATWLFGTELAIVRSTGGNPLVAVAVPQATLSSSAFSSRAGNVYSGLMTKYTRRGTQDQRLVYLIPDSTGRVFTLSEALSVNTTSSRSQLGSLSCSNLNSPLNGFCNGTLSLQEASGTGNAACLFSMGTNSKDLIFCSAQNPSNTKTAVTIIAGTSARSVLALSASYLGLAAGTSTGTIPVTVQNLTSRPISTLSLPTGPSHPFSQPATLSGSATVPFSSGSSCGTTLPAFSSCTVNITYSPSTQQANGDTFRVSYDNGVSNPNATVSLLASRGLSSIAVTAPAFAPGSTGQASVTATFANGSTQDITQLTTLATSDSSLSVSSASGTYGQLSAANSATTTLTATFGASTNSTLVTVVLPIISIASQPSNQSTSTGSATFNVSASVTQGATLSYQWQKSTVSGGSTYSNINGATASSLALNGLTGADHGFNYRVVVSATGGATSVTSSVAALSVTAPDPSSLVATANSASAISLSWASGGGTTSSFTLAYQSGATPPNSCALGTIISGISSTATSYTVSSLSGGTAYAFRLCAATSSGSLSSGVTASATTQLAVPPDPSNLVASALSATSLLVSWTSGGGSTTGFTLAYQTGSTAPANCSSGTVVSSLASSASSYALTGLATGTQYSMRLCALNAGAVSSSGVTATGTTIALPPNPTLFAATAASASQIDLSWTSGGGSTASFTVAYQTGATAPASCSTGTVVSGISSSPRSITGLAAATQYSFRLCALNSVADTSSGVTGTATTNAAAAPDPTGFTATASGTSQINLGWTSGGGATASFTVAYQTGATAPANCSTGTLISNIASSASSQSVTGLAGGTTYSFRLCALNSNNTASSGVTASDTTGAAASVAVSINFGTNQTVITPSSGSASTTTAQTTMSALTALAAVGTNPISTLTLSGNGTFTWDVNPAGGVGNLTVGSASTLTASAYARTTASADDYGLSPVAPFQQGNGRMILSITGVFTNNGTVTMAGRGYPGGLGNEAGYSHAGYNAGGAGRLGTGSWFGSGGSYGTLGSAGSNSSVGSTYGASDFWTALYLGSGGSGYTAACNGGLTSCGGAGAGGGAISISAAVIANNGTITAAGGNGGNRTGGGSGGTINLSATASLSNNGIITTAGGTGAAGGGAGGSGRVRLVSSLVNQNGTLTGVGPDSDTNVTSVVISLNGNSTLTQTIYGSSTTLTVGTINSISSLLSVITGSYRPSIAFSGTGTFTFDQSYSATQGFLDLAIGNGQTVLINVAPTGLRDLTINNGGTLTFSDTASSLRDITINSGGTLNASAYARTTASADDYGLSPVAPFQQGNGRLILSITGVFTNNGTVTMAGRGYPGGRGNEAGYSHAGYNAGGAGRLGTGSWFGSGGSYGTLGSAGSNSSVGSTYGASDFWTALYLGSGGSGYTAACNGGLPSCGGAGAGGGAISISAAVITNNGTITAAGGNGGNRTGGGSGGTINLSATASLSNNGIITTAGGTGAAGGGAGGHGRVRLAYGALGSMAGSLAGVVPGEITTINSVTVALATGVITFNATAYSTNISWLGYGNTLSALNAATGTNTISSLTLSGSGTFTLDTNPIMSIGNLTLGTGSTLTASAYARTTASADDYGLSPVAPFQQGNGRLILSITGTFTNNGTVTMAGLGYPGGRGNEAGYSHAGYNAGGAGRLGTGSWFGSGGSYGTLGVAGSNSSVGSTYGASDFWTALYLGSGGSGYTTACNGGLTSCGGAGAGGGAISISAAVIANNGTITAAGGNGGNRTGGGSGGTINLSAPTSLSNNGTITTAGGTGANGGGAGGSGRVRLNSNVLNIGSCTGMGISGVGCAQ